MRRRIRRRSTLIRVAADAPISDLNTTPLIDVLLVLLIMFILTIPIATHSVKIDLPTGPGPGHAEPETHSLALDRAGRLAFDGDAVAPAALAPQLRAMVARSPESVLNFRADGDARYEDFDRTLAIVKGAGVERLGFVGNEGFVGALEQ